MKKLFTFALALASFATLSAESVQTLSCGLGLPGVDEPQLMGLSLSPDGKFVCGAIEMGEGIFIADVENSQVIFSLAGDEGGELRHVTNTGLAVGITDVGVTYDFETQDLNEMVAPAGYKYILCEDITNDGSMIVGSLVGASFSTTAAYQINGGEWIPLPVPTEEELCGIKTNLASSAKFVSADGKVIFGCLGSFTVPIVWTRNDDGEYEFDFFLPRILKMSEEDLDDPSKPLIAVSSMYISMSNNGKYVSMLGHVANGSLIDGGDLKVPVLYDTEKKEVIVYDKPQDIDPRELGLYICAVCDDGTFIGTVGQPYYFSVGSFIWKSGEEHPELYKDAFPVFAEKFGYSDTLGFNMPTSMSADGRYILGYTFDSQDNYTQSGYYVTYVIDREGQDSGIGSVNVDSASVTPEAIYNINGQRLNGLTKGVNIVRMSDGTAVKVVR